MKVKYRANIENNNGHNNGMAAMGGLCQHFLQKYYQFVQTFNKLKDTNNTKFK